MGGRQGHRNVVTNVIPAENISWLKELLYSQSVLNTPVGLSILNRMANMNETYRHNNNKAYDVVKVPRGQTIMI